MVKPTLTQRFGVTPVKAAAVGVLVLILIGVLYSQFSSSTAPTASNRKARAKRAKTNAVAKARTTRASKKRNSQKRNTPVGARKVVASKSPVPSIVWKKMDLETATRNNPFLLPAALIVDLSEEAVPTDAVLKQLEEERLAKEESDRQKAQFAAAEKARLKYEALKKQAEALAAARRKHEAFVEAEANRIKDRIQSIKDSGSAIVSISQSSRVIRIDGKSYSIGESFEGIRIVSILENGSFVLEPERTDYEFKYESSTQTIPSSQTD